MKWYLAVSAASLTRPDHDWRTMIAVAIASARKHTRLDPVLLLDGDDAHIEEICNNFSVDVVKHRVSFYDALANHMPDHPHYAQIASGCFMRTEIPLIDKKSKYVLYTDADVMFVKDPYMEQFATDLFLCGPEIDVSDKGNINTGVMLMNLPKLRISFDQFRDYIVKNLHRFQTFDQDAYKQFYAGKFGVDLPIEWNWKPYYGTSAEARIVHFHGPKPDQIRKILQKEPYAGPPLMEQLVSKAPDDCYYYMKEWESMRNRMHEQHRPWSIAQRIARRIGL